MQVFLFHNKLRLMISKSKLTKEDGLYKATMQFFWRKKLFSLEHLDLIAKKHDVELLVANKMIIHTFDLGVNKKVSVLYNAMTMKPIALQYKSPEDEVVIDMNHRRIEIITDRLVKKTNIISYDLRRR